jgi:hypothetical protein
MNNLYIKLNSLPKKEDRIGFLIDNVGYSASEGNYDIVLYKKNAGAYEVYNPVQEDYYAIPADIYVRIALDDTKFDYRAHKNTTYSGSDYDEMEIGYIIRSKNTLNQAMTNEDAIKQLVENDAVEKETLTIQLPATDSEFVLINITANTGIPRIIPGTLKNPPNKVMEKITQKPSRPVESPRILGPITLPSICCSTSMKIRKNNVLSGCIGSTTNIRSALGIAPRKGPK